MSRVEVEAFANLETGKIEPGVVTGIGEPRIAKLKVFPNPARNRVYVELGKGRAEHFTVEILDLNGNKILANAPVVNSNGLLEVYIL